jgi:hypothetical protein
METRTGVGISSHRVHKLYASYGWVVAPKFERSQLGTTTYGSGHCIDTNTKHSPFSLEEAGLGTRHCPYLDLESSTGSTFRNKSLEKLRFSHLHNGLIADLPSASPKLQSAVLAILGRRDPKFAKQVTHILSQQAAASASSASSSGDLKEVDVEAERFLSGRVKRAVVLASAPIPMMMDDDAQRCSRDLFERCVASSCSFSHVLRT